MTKKNISISAILFSPTLTKGIVSAVTKQQLQPSISAIWCKDNENQMADVGVHFSCANEA